VYALLRIYGPVEPESIREQKRCMRAFLTYILQFYNQKIGLIIFYRNVGPIFLIRKYGFDFRLDLRIAHIAIREQNRDSGFVHV
jgi:hypothetical protein